MFGGGLTVLFIVVASHVFIYWVFLSVSCNDGHLLPPPTNVLALQNLCRILRDNVVPAPTVVLAYLGYLAAMAALAMICPGPIVFGYPLVGASKTKKASNSQKADGGGEVRLAYRCNALSAWWVTLLIVAVATVTWGDAPLVWVADKWGELLTCAVVTADLVSVLAYTHAIASGEAERMTGILLYDFFMVRSSSPND